MKSFSLEKKNFIKLASFLANGLTKPQGVGKTTYTADKNIFCFLIKPRRLAITRTVFKKIIRI